MKKALDAQLDEVQLAERAREATKVIKFRTLQLCQAIGAAAPPSRRLEAALDSIKAGARLALDEVQGAAERRAEVASLPHDRNVK